MIGYMGILASLKMEGSYYWEKGKPVKKEHRRLLQIGKPGLDFSIAYPYFKDKGIVTVHPN